MMWGTVNGAELATVIAWESGAALKRLLIRSPFALGATLGLAAYFAWEYRTRLRDAPAAAKELGARAALSAIPHITRAFEQREEVDRRVQARLVARGPERSIEQAIARVLLHQVHPLAARDIHALLPVASREAITPDDVMDNLREHEPFELVRGRGWTLGHQAPRARSVTVHQS